MQKVNTEEELGKAIEDDSAEISIENPILGKVVFKIKKAGKTKWVIAVGAIAAVLTAVFMAVPTLATGPAALIPESIFAAMATTSGSAAVAILGLATTISAIKICLKSKNTKVLNKLRDNYDIVGNKDGVIILRKKRKSTIEI